MPKFTTAQDLFDFVDDMVEEELRALGKLTAAQHLELRKKILESTRNLWNKAGVDPRLDADVGNVIYVSKAEAMKYGRFELLSKEIAAEVKRQAALDIANFEISGTKIYENTYLGYKWAYDQGYGVRSRLGVTVKAVADAMYSDFYGKPFYDTVRENWQGFYDRMMADVLRNLNQGKSYTQMARDIQNMTDRSYSDAMRVAVTEGGRIESQAYLDGLAILDDSDIPYEKVWNSTIDDRTREDHQEMDGEAADSNGVFHLPGGATGPAPRMTGVAKQDINCRCFTTTIINGQRPTERRIRGEGIVPYETYKERLARNAIPVREVRKSK